MKKDKIKKEVDKRRKMYAGGKRPKMGGGYLERETRKADESTRKRRKAEKDILKSL